MNKINITEKQLRIMYSYQNMNVSEIAEIYRCSESGIYYLRKNIR